MSDEARLERENAHYRRELTELGIRLLRAQDESGKFLRDATRYRMVIRLLRDLSRLREQGNAAVITSTSLEIIAEFQLCDRAAFLREVQDRPGVFQFVQTIGFSVPPARAVTVVSPPPFTFAAGMTDSDIATAQICAAIGSSSMAWCYDPASGFALLLAYARDDAPAGNYSAADYDILDAVMAAYLDAIEQLQPSIPAFEPEALVDDHLPREVSTVEAPIAEAELKRSLLDGGQVTGVLAVERSIADGGEYAIYLRVTWSSDYRILIATKSQRDRTYRELSRLVSFARSMCGFHGDVSVRLQGDPLLRRLPGISAMDRVRAQDTVFPSFAKTESA